MKKGEYVYVLVEDDEYEFPVQITDTIAEMSAITGIDRWRLLNAIRRGSSIDGFKIYKVDIRESEEDED